MTCIYCKINDEVEPHWHDPMCPNDGEFKNKIVDRFPATQENRELASRYDSRWGRFEVGPEIVLTLRQGEEESPLSGFFEMYSK